MATFIKWTVFTAAAVTGAVFAYSTTLSARRKISRGLKHADQMAEDAKRVLEATQQALSETQRTVRHLRATVSP